MTKLLINSEKILSIHTLGSLSLDQGGPSVTVPELCRNLCYEGSIVKSKVVTCHSITESSPAPPEIGGVDVLWGNRSNTYQLLGATVDSAKQLSVVMHDHGQWLSINHASARIARHRQIPRIVSPRGMLSPWSLNHKKWKKRLAWYLYAKRDLECANAIHATSDLEMQELRMLGVRQPIVLIPNGVSALASISEHNVSHNRRYCLFMSRIHIKKGILELLDAWTQINPEGWDLIVAGPDEQGIMNRAKLKSNVRYVGSVSGVEKSRLLHNASFFVLPTHSENFGVVVAESLMASVPVITTHCAPWEGLLEQGCGWWIPNSRQDLNKTLRQALSMPPSELKLMGERGKNWVIERFSWSAIGRQMADAYGWLLGFSASTPSCVHCK